MSHKKAKLLRKLTKQYMENQNKIQYSLQHLENYIQLSIILTGKKPDEITLTQDFYNWYIQESQRHAETLGLNLGFKNDAVTFMGVKLSKKSTIIVQKKVN